jgi:hypothetical protein
MIKGMHDQKWGEGSDKPIIPMTKCRVKTHNINYMSLDNNMLKTISGAIHRSGNENTI